MSKIDQKPKSKIQSVKIIQNLRPMLIDKFGHSFQLNNNATETNEIRNEELFKFRAFVFQFQFRLGNERNRLPLKFDLEAFLINGFSKSAAFFFIDFEAGSHYLVRFFPINYLSHNEFLF